MKQLHAERHFFTIHHNVINKSFLNAEWETGILSNVTNRGGSSFDMGKIHNPCKS